MVKKSRYQKLDKAGRQRYMDKVKATRLANPCYYLWRKAKRRAEKEGLLFDIEVTDVVIPKLCPVFGIPIGPLMGQNNGASIDRIEPDKGYTKGNIVVISRRANTLKGNATIHELIDLARFYSSYLQSGN